MAGIFRNKWVLVFICIAIPTALLAGAYAWVNSNRSLMWTLNRGSTDKRTPSELPYEIALRTSLRGGIPFPEGGPPKEWILKLPSNFVTSEIGRNGDVLVKDGGGFGGSYFVDMSANVGVDGQAFTAMFGKSDDDRLNRGMLFNLTNNQSLSEIADNDLCVPDSKRNEILGAHGNSGWIDQPCDSFKYCGISMHMNGWDVKISASKDLASNPEKACALARQFLDKYTLRRDDLRAPKQN